MTRATTTAKAMTAVVAAATALVALAGCSGADSKEPEPAPTTSKGKPSTGASSSGGGTTSEADVTEPAEACVPAGTKANDKGVGAFCNAQTKCAGGAFCTADFGAPVGAQFCTLICEKDDDCGKGASCFHEARGNGCVPDACLDEK